MSASLVGSEMCIRDRNRIPTETARWQRHWQRSQGAPSSPSNRGGYRSPCLLYTSDAADDM
eukprot:3327185-Alexandrium_andersonii.AAC.1